MTVQGVTWAEIAAYGLLYGGMMDSRHGIPEIHRAADELILMAEKIKAERAVAAMEWR